MSTGLKGNTDGSGAIQVGGSDAITITTGLNVVVNGTTSLAKSTLYWPSATQQGFTLRALDVTFAASPILFQNSVGGTSGFIGQTTSNVTYNTSSDYRLKENVQPMTGALAAVAQLKPCTYNWKVDGAAGQGFIAHELQEVVPDCVTGAKDAMDEDGNPKYQGIDTSFLVATLTAAIQELKAEVDALRAQIEVQ